MLRRPTRLPQALRRLLVGLGVAALAACDAGPGGGAGEGGLDAAARPTDAADAPTADVAVVDATLGVPGATCADTSACAEGRCVHGVCSLDCVDAAACPLDQHCVARGGLRLCTPTCDAASPCATGQRCVADAPGRGHCVAQGPGAPGAPCDAAEDCASWFCAQGVCLGDCIADADCGPSARCLPLHVGGVCTEVGAGAREAPCLRGADCASGVCRGGGCADACDATAGIDPCADDRHCTPYAELALCERACVGPESCGERGLCLPGAEGRLCRTRGNAAAGEACDEAADCRGGHCTGGVCAADCDAGCPAATACVRDVTGATCRPAGAQAENTPCARGEECRSGFCAAGRCGRDCAADAACPVGMACVAFTEGRFCFPGCGLDADCESVAYCAHDLAARSVCFWRGAATEGELCRRDFECASGLCRGERCLGACLDGTCAGGLACRDFRRGAFCTALPAPIGAECYADAECTAGARCNAGRCMPNCADACPEQSICPPGAALCAPICARDADCNPGFVCQRHDGAVPFCAPRGIVPSHGACTHGAECETGLCHAGRCENDCPACNNGPGGGAEGSPCLLDAACASGLCVAGVCVRTCPEAGCAAGRACVFVEDARICATPCSAGERPCPEGLFCVDAPGAAPLCRGPRAGAPAFAACVDDIDCAAEAPVCRDATCRPVCTEPANCPEGTDCRETPGGLGLCTRAGAGPLMAACARDADCAPGLCEAGRCYGACRPGCGDSAHCVDAARDPEAPARRCVPACADDTTCPPGTACRFDAHGLGGCY
jgi:hypothetical protein